MTRSPAQAEQLIINLTKSNSTKQVDEERARTGVADPQELNEIRTSLHSIQNMLKKKVSFVDNVEEFDDKQEEDCNYIGGSGFQGQRFQSGNFLGNGFQRNNQSGFASNQFQKPSQGSGYTRTYGAEEYQKPAPIKSDDIQGMFEQLLEGQNKLTGSLNGKIDALYNEFNAKFEAINVHMKKLDTQVAQTAEGLRRQSNVLPGRTEQNPREHCNAVFTTKENRRPTTITVDPVIKDLVEVEDMDVSDEDEVIEAEAQPEKSGVSVDRHQYSVDRHPSGIQIQKASEDNVDRHQSSVDRHQAKKASSEASVDRHQTSIDRHPIREDKSECCVDRHHLGVDRHPPQIGTSEKSVDRHHLGVDRHPKEKGVKQPISEPSTETSEYKPRIPYPKTPGRSRREIEDAQCKEVLDLLSVRIPYFKECKMATAVRKDVEKMVSKVITWEEGVKKIEDTCIKMLLKKLPKKMGDPGTFVLSCEINKRVFEHSLCDSGSSVNVVPLSVAKDWGKLEPSNMVLTLADQSRRKAAGLLEDVLVKVDEHWIPTDFVVMEYDQEPKDPIILGRPFLATAKAKIDFANSKVHLHLGDTVQRFDMNREEKATIDGQTFQVNTIQEPAFECNEVTESREETHKLTVPPKSTEASTDPPTAVKQKAPDITPKLPHQKQKNITSLPPPKSARKCWHPPKHKPHPGAVPTFLGRLHAPTAYTPPWMRRLSRQHSPDPPDA